MPAQSPVMTMSRVRYVLLKTIVERDEPRIQSANPFATSLLGDRDSSTDIRHSVGKAISVLCTRIPRVPVSVRRRQGTIDV